MIEGTVTLEISERQIERALRAGDARNDQSVERNYKNWGGPRTPTAQLTQNRLGCLCEIVAGDHFGLPFDDGVGNIDSVDLSVMEVRGRWNVSGRDELGIRAIRREDGTFVPIDKHLERPHLLVRVSEDRRYALLVGWLLGHEAVWMGRQNPMWWNGPSGCWYIPEENLHSVPSLQQWLWAGHPLHTWSKWKQD
jgi:hypothetical protein